MSPAPVAAIDCGTNSIRLLIARRDDDTGQLVDLERHMEIVRLGYGVDRTGRFDPAAIDRTLDATRRYARLIDHHGADRIRFGATSATRDAENRAEFISGVQEILGITPEVITGADEAALSFRGAVSTIPALAELDGAALVVDIGGGSTELVLGRDEPDARISEDIGSVRLTERHLRTDPPTPAEVDAARADIDALLDEASAAVDLSSARAVVGVGGTVTTITALALGLTEYQPDIAHGAELGIETLIATCRRVLHLSTQERSALSIIHPGRVDVIGAGALIWERVLMRLADNAGAGLSTAWSSEHDILDGIALSLMDGPPTTA
ncbi:MAG: exopolyphosphatase [Brachybacterium sp.]|nr:exopolyphosphatase [Brachybacterium sp.]